MADDIDIAGLIQRVTAQVKAHLEQAGGPAGRKPGRLVVVLPAWTARLEALAAQVGPLKQQGFDCIVLAPQTVLEEIKESGLEGVFGQELKPLEKTGLGRLLAGLGRGDAVLLGSLGFAGARRMALLDDDDPVVRLVTQALLRGVNAAALTDDLAPGRGVPQNRLAGGARASLRDMEGLGLTLLTLDGLPVWMARVAALDTRAADTFDGLLTEEDVKRLAVSGKKRVTVARGTIVTPLAQSMAIGLGITIVRQD